MNSTNGDLTRFVAKLLATAVIVAGALVALEATWVMLGAGGARAREVGVAQVVRLPMLYFGLDLFRLLPDSWSHYYELSSFSQLLSFLLVAIPASLVVLVMVLAVLVPMSWAFSRSGSPDAVRAAMADRWHTYGALLATACLGSLFSRRFGHLLPVIEQEWLGWVIRGLLLVGIAIVVRAMWLWLGRMIRFVRPAVAVLGALVVLNAVVLPFLSASKAARPGAPNILLISIDSLRADHLESYGYFRQTSPHLTQLASEGVRFEKVITPTSWTLPTHVTMLTGLASQQHGVVVDGMRLPLEATTLAEALAAAGYQTTGIVSGPFLRAEYGHSQGFDWYDDFTTVPQRAEDLWSDVSSPKLSRLVRDSLRRWDEGSRKRPFFIFLHMFDVHFDYIPPAPYGELYDSGYEGPISGRDVEYTDLIGPDMPKRDLEHLVALYDGEINFVDEHIAQILGTLSDLDVLDDTIVAVTADHGEEFLDHGGRTHHKTLYEEVLRVPLIIRYPKKIPAGTTVSRPVRTMDVAGTLLALAGVKPSAGAWVSNRGHLYEPLDLTRLFRPGGALVPPFASYGELHGEIVSVRTEQRKLIVDLLERQGPELYDLQADPAETRNLAGQPELYGPLWEALAVWREQAPSPLAVPVRIDAEQLEVLRALGYVR